MHSTEATSRYFRTPVQSAALVVAYALLVTSGLGLVARITVGDDAVGAGAGAGFYVSAFHDVVHLVFGALGVVLARTSTAARGYLLGGGGTYVALLAVALIVPADGWANAENWLDLGMGATMITLGATLGAVRITRRRPQTTTAQTVSRTECP